MKVKLQDLIPGRVYRDMDGDEGTWDGERFHMQYGGDFKPTTDGPYNLEGWVDVTPEAPANEAPAHSPWRDRGDTPMPVLRRLFCAEFDFADSRLDEEGYLDEMVHDSKSEEATNINNGGLRAQLLYLLGME